MTASLAASRSPVRSVMTEAPVAGTLFRLTLPVAGGVLALLGYRLAEIWFVARLGAPELAAISFAFPVTMVVLSLSIGLGAGSSSVIARALGAGETDVPNLVGNALLLTALVGTVAAIIGVALADPLSRLLGADGQIAPMIASYLRIWFPTAILVLVASVGLSAARAAGDAAFQGTAMIGSSLLNLAVAPVAILGFGEHTGLGLRGAPIANAVAWAPLVVATIWRLRQLDMLAFDHLSLAGFVAASRRILRVGGPAAATNTVIPVASGIVTAILAPFGHAAVAGFGLGSRVEAVAMVAFFALSAVINPFAGQNFGAGRLDRVRDAMRVCIVFCLTSGAALAVLLYAASPWIVGLFTADPQITRAARSYLMLVPLSYGAGGIIAVVNAAFNGLNRPLAAVAISVARTLVVNVPLAWVGGRLFGPTGIFLGICGSNLLVGLGSAVWIMRATRDRSPDKPAVQIPRASTSPLAADRIR